MGLSWTMKLWVSLTTCLIVLSAMHASPPRRNTLSPDTKRRPRTSESPLDLPPVQIRVSITNTGTSLTHIDTSQGEGAIVEEKYTMEELLPERYENVVDFIKVTVSRIRRSSTASTAGTAGSASDQEPSFRTRQRRERKKSASKRSRGGGGARAGEVGRKGGGGGANGRGQGCMLKQIQLNVSDLGLGYKSEEEMIFRYCSGPCRKSETNYDKILNNLSKNKKFPPKDRPPHTCCRPIAFDDDISFLDDNLIYHTMRKHSARKCGCV